MRHLLHSSKKSVAAVLGFPLVVILLVFFWPRSGGDLLIDSQRIVSCQILPGPRAGGEEYNGAYFAFEGQEVRDMVNEFLSTAFYPTSHIKRKLVQDCSIWHVYFRYDDGTGICLTFDSNRAFAYEIPPGWPAPMGSEKSKYENWRFLASDSDFFDLVTRNCSITKD